jgi:acetyl esterase/lipase
MRIFSAFEEGQAEGGSSIAALFFHGGGLVGGDPCWWDTHASYLATHGVTALVPEYRTKNKDKSSARDAIDDSIAAVDWAQINICEELVLVGASAGAILAFHAMLHVKVRGVVLLNPVVDTSSAGFRNKQINDDVTISPIHMIETITDLPECLIIHCKDDNVVPFLAVTSFYKKWQKGSLKLHDKGGHGFFNRPRLMLETNKEILSFCLKCRR